MWIDDEVIQSCQRSSTIRIWVPKEPYVVLGNANSLAECHVRKCEEDGVDILRRYGGGGAVVLHPGCIVVSFGLWVKDLYKNGFYFSLCNQALIRSLQHISPALNGLQERGISDIAIDSKKIAGTSMFRSKNYLLFQASLLVEDGMDLIERYLPHPSSEPEYRQGKSHHQFLSFLQEHTELGVEQVAEGLQEVVPKYVANFFQGQLISADMKHCGNLFKRVKRRQSIRLDDSSEEPRESIGSL